MITFVMSDGQTFEGFVERSLGKDGEGKPSLRGFLPVFGKGTYAVSVKASGPELAFIADNFSGIPMPRASVATWRGEFALFIAENLV